MKPAPKLYALLKRAIKRESLRNKLQRSDEPESRVDQKTLEEQERQAERSAMELIENEEAEKQAQASKKEKAKKKKAREKERKEKKKDTVGGSPGDKADDSDEEGSDDKAGDQGADDKPVEEHVKQASNKKAARSTTVAPTKQLLVNTPAADVDNSKSNKETKIDLHNSQFIGAGSLLDMLGDSDGEEEGEFDAELEAFKMKLEMSQMPPERPRPKITLNPEALKSLRSLKQ